MNFLRIRQYILRVAHIFFLANPFKYRQTRVKILEHFFRESVTFLNKTGEGFRLDFGTLLGYYREKAIILHDIDIDFAMEGESYEKVLKIKDQLPKGIRLYDTSYKHSGPKLYLSYKGYDADIYFYEDLGEGIQSFEDPKFTSEKQVIPKSLVFPIKKVDFLGTKVGIPNEPKKYLEFVYGYLGKDGKRDLKTGFWESPVNPDGRL